MAAREEIINQLAKEFKISKEHARIVYSAPDAKIREVVTSGTKNRPETFKNINVVGLGKFVLMRNAIYKMMEAYKEEEDE